METNVDLVAFNQSRVRGRVGQVEILIGESRYVSRVVAVPDGASALSILGRRDFFLNFYVGFDSSKRSFCVATPRAR